MVYNYQDGAGLPRKTGTLFARELPKDGNRSWKVTTQPSVEPVTLDEVKTFGRIDTTEEDTLIEGFIQTARMAAEEYLGRAFISQTITTILDFWPAQIVELPRPPLISVTEIVATDEDADETEYDSDNYYLNTNAEPGQIIIKRNSSLPSNTARDFARFTIRSVHGYGTLAADVPQQLKNGIMVWATIIYSTRAIDPKNPPPEVQAALSLFKKTSVVIR